MGFFPGWIQPLCGSVLYRSAQFAAYEAAYTRLEDVKSLRTVIPNTAGLELRILTAGVFSGTVRSLIECPFEYIKVKRQTAQTWASKDIYRGFTSLYIRSTAMMTTYFVVVDFYKRNTNLFQSKLGQFWVSGSASVIGWFIIWPFEVMKNISQAETPGSGKTTADCAKYVMQKYGHAGFMRGFVPGAMSVFFRNGAAFIVM